MRNILVFGPETFVTDLEVTVLTQDIEGVEFGFAYSLEQALNMLDKGGWDEFLIFSAFLEQLDLDTIGIPVTSYARNPEGIDMAARLNVRCYGIAARAGDLLKNILSESFTETEAKKPAREPVNSPERSVERMSEEPEIYLSERIYEPQNTIRNTAGRPVETEREKEKEEKKYHTERPFIRESYPGEEETPVSVKSESGDVRKRLNRIREQKQTKLPEEKKTEVIPKVYKKAKVITVYSAKGGVGKTTIACNLATFLSLTAAGRDHYHVAVIDFNIDFGDVMSTLGFEADKVTMSAWAGDIRDRLSHGEKPEEICYPEQEIRSYMQINKESGLYALLAPVSNEESMDIEEEEIRIMLRNVTDYGGFDFVICDTGNNIKDAAVIPVESADQVLIVLTQSVNTANCCFSFIRTMYELGMDMSHFYTVVNEARPGRQVGVMVDELKEILENPVTGRPFPCLGIIDDDNAVRSSVNDMVPLVYKADHRYTKAIGQIAAKIIGEEHVLQVSKKKKRMFRFLK